MLRTSLTILPDWVCSDSLQDGMQDGMLTLGDLGAAQLADGGPGHAVHVEDEGGEDRPVVGDQDVPAAGALFPTSQHHQLLAWQKKEIMSIVSLQIPSNISLL